MKPELTYLLDREDLNELQYSVVVTSYERILGTGSGKRKFKDEFSTENERRRVRELYKLFYNWYLVKGVPESYWVTLERYNFMIRVVNFFGIN